MAVGDEPSFVPIDEGPDFVRGMALGLLVARLTATPPPPIWRATVRARDRDLFAEHARTLGYTADFAETEDPFWLFADFARRPPLRLVKK